MNSFVVEVPEVLQSLEVALGVLHFEVELSLVGLAIVVSSAFQIHIQDRTVSHIIGRIHAEGEVNLQIHVIEEHRGALGHKEEGNYYFGFDFHL